MISNNCNTGIIKDEATNYKCSVHNYDIFRYYHSFHLDVLNYLKNQLNGIEDLIEFVPDVYLGFAVVVLS